MLLNNRAVLLVYGSDVQNFLQKLLTNDIMQRYCYTYLLDNRGRYLFDFFVYRENENSYYIDIYKDDMDEICNILNMYKLRSDVNIELSNIHKITYSKEKLDNAISFQDPRYEKMGFRSIIKESLLTDFNEDQSNYSNDRYKYAIPEGFTDLIRGRSMPLHYGADLLNAIDYKKGCYIGQEIISRTKYQGVIRKKIFKITLPISDIKDGSKLFDLQEEEVGIICSSYKNSAICLIRDETASEIFVSDKRVKLEIPPWRNS